MTTPDIQVENAINGQDDSGNFLAWAWVKGRARTVFGNLNAIPFNRVINNTTVAATPSDLDHGTLAAEEVSWRYIDSRQDTADSPDNVVDLKDIMIIWWEHFLATTDSADVAAAIAQAKILRNWPTTYAGRPGWEPSGIGVQS